jgi:hypothetical protein
MSLAVVVCNGLPQPLTRLFAPITQRRGNPLPSLAAQGNPHPGLVHFFEHKRPQFISFQRRGSGILGIEGDQGGTSRRKLSYFVLIQLDTVVPETPNVRVKPRKRLAFLRGMQDLMAASLWRGVGSGVLAALPSSLTTAIELFATLSVAIVYQSFASLSEGNEG